MNHALLKAARGYGLDALNDMGNAIRLRDAHYAQILVESAVRSARAAARYAHDAVEGEEDVTPALVELDRAEVDHGFGGLMTAMWGGR